MAEHQCGKVAAMSRGRVGSERLPTKAPLDSTDEDSSHRDDYFSAEEYDAEGDGGDDGDTLSPFSYSRRRTSLQIRIPPNSLQTDLSFSALQYLPMPILVLSSRKTVVLANEAMGRLMGIEYEAELAQKTDSAALETVSSQEAKSPTEILYGQTLARLGVDLLQGGDATMISWETFLDTLVGDALQAHEKPTHITTQYEARRGDEDVTPTEKAHRRSASTLESEADVSRGATRTMVHDAVMDVVFSTNRDRRTGLPLTSRSIKTDHIQSQMICSVWNTGPGEDEQFFTLTFTAAPTDGASSSSSSTSTKAMSRNVSSRSATAYSNNSHPSGRSSASSSSSHSELKRAHAQSPPAAASLNSPTITHRTNFPPRGPPGKSSVEAPSMFTKTNKLKEALLNSMNIPAYAMWKDESFGIPNKAAVRLIYPWIESGSFERDEEVSSLVQPLD